MTGTTDFPCHALPPDQWCDRNGERGGFMGHTCNQPPDRIKLTRDEILVLLIEESGEVIHAATKCLRFGYDVDHGTGYGNNRLRLSEELGQLDAVRERLDLNMAAFRTSRACLLYTSDAADDTR